MKYVMQLGQKDQPIFILLHGTGGNEESLLDVGKAINNRATLIGIRGNVLEDSYPRYFKRLEEGLYDEADLAERAVELHHFIQKIVMDVPGDNKDIVLIGYSNGANIGIRLLLDYPDNYRQAILFHPMYPVVVPEKNDLRKTKIFASMGTQDPIVSVINSQYVLSLFNERHAAVTEEWTISHQLTYDEVTAAKNWLDHL
ncbi:alpha/beta hydrolase [Vagococcus vulneris]|uniref:Carboxylesterase n=1 Tax=Vagococcus vulneris TaxID=1977869 RepID=A0A430A0B3_9ENTE|nr:alpha/beta hydrolase [Vagococcus vulneris]RST99745.1 carboxylesterase [Vagococcus vulneris]